MTQYIDHRGDFQTLFNQLCTTTLFKKMEATVEGSPWHREANVLVHTQMVVDEFKTLIGGDTHEWSRESFIGAISCAFHDTGKPPAEIEKFSEERGKYRAYHGHELLSAHEWQNYAAKHGELFTADEIFRVMWMIEYHMPWNIEAADKRKAMAMTAQYFGNTVYAFALLADQFGRISDDQETKNKRARDWVREFLNMSDTVKLPTVTNDRPFAIMPIAPSGAGKSTYLKKLREEGRNIVVYSLDLLRHEFYDTDDYAKAYAESVADKSFEARAKARFHAIVKDAAATGADLYIDNTNLSAKRRKWYLDIVRKHHFQTRAVVMPVALDVLLERQYTRGDKNVPANAVIMQYKSLQTPMIGEFDEIVVSDHNIIQTS